MKWLSIFQCICQTELCACSLHAVSSEDWFASVCISCNCIQVRVMPRCWYVLLRFFLRVDKVLVKLRETRIFCPFSDNTTVGPIIKEIRYSEGTFEELSAAGAPPDGVSCCMPMSLTTLFFFHQGDGALHLCLVAREPCELNAHRTFTTFKL